MSKNGIGAVIRLGSSGASLALGGHTWNLGTLDRGQRTTLATMLCDAAGIHERKGTSRTRRRARRQQKDA